MQISIKERFDLRIKSNDLKLLMMIGPVRSIVLESKKHDVAGKDANEINTLQYMWESIFFSQGEMVLRIIVFVKEYQWRRDEFQIGKFIM